MKLFLIVCASLIFFASCKKEEKKTLPTSSLPCPTINTDSFTGYFICGTYSSNIGGGPMTFVQGANARFYSQPSTGIYGANQVKLDNILVNNDTLHYDVVTGYSLVSPNLAVDKWSIEGKSVPYFSYTNSNPFPNCSDFNVSPDSVSKLVGCTFTISNITNMTWGNITVGDGVSNQALSYTLTMGTNVITLSPSQLSSFATNPNGYVSIQIQNTSIINACDRNYKFIKEAQIIKKMNIKP